MNEQASERLLSRQDKVEMLYGKERMCRNKGSERGEENDEMKGANTKSKVGKKTEKKRKEKRGEKSKG